jgi:hypothetical protein
MRGTRALAPGSLARGRSLPFFDAVAQVEAARIARGRPTPGIVHYVSP